MDMRPLTVVVLLAFPMLLCGTGEFWNDKKPSDWTEAEARELLSNSPWAKPVQPEIRDNAIYGNQAYITLYGGIILTPPRNRKGPAGAVPMSEMIVRWETAAPVRAAQAKLKAEIPDKSKNFYIVSVSGFPVDPQGKSGEEIKELLLDTALLKVKNKPLRPDDVQMLYEAHGKERRGLLLFLFPRSPEIKSSDKEVTFEWKMGPMLAEAKFLLREMTVNDQLAL